MEFGRLLCLPLEVAQKVQNKKKNLLWILRAASSSYELPAIPPPSKHVATNAKVSTAATAKKFCNLKFLAFAHYFCGKH
jgi:hypothetical protein